MLDIKWIRENREAFDKGRARRGLAPMSDALLALDEARRAAISRLQLAQERRNAASKEIGAALKEKDAAVRGQDFEKAGSLRDREMELKAQIAALSSKKSEEAAAEAEDADAGPTVTEKDIAGIVASVGHQRQRSGPEAAAGLDDDEEGVESDAGGHCPVELVGGQAMGMAVPMRVNMPMMVVIVVVIMSFARHARIIPMTAFEAAIPLFFVMKPPE